MRKLLFIALLATACSYSEELAQITVTVSNIPATADHLDVFLCTPAATCNADNATRKYRPSFQPGSLSPAAVDLAFAPLSANGTFTVEVDAFDRTNPTPSSSAAPLAKGTVSGAVPSQIALQVTLQ